MELMRINNSVEALDISHVEVSTLPFLEANTSEIALREIRERHVIPVFLKDNEPTISQVEFVGVVAEAARDVFGLSITPSPMVRVSHPIKGRTFDARHKKAQDLLPHEKTIYYERMAFMITIPGITDEINGNLLELTVGGVKAYNLDNLNSIKGSPEHFKVFVGFRNFVCTNLCVSTDGVKLDIRAKSLEDLYQQVFQLFQDYDAVNQLSHMNQFAGYYLEERQFAQIIGRARLYQFLPRELKAEVPELLINDTQVSRVAECYYTDPNFQREENGEIDLWGFYNLMTGATKHSYIDKYLERGVNSFDFTRRVQEALESPSHNFWYLR
ncbi:protein of unknown function [Belliella buryatensis]|uniref:DUF3871 family protein n=1 Tax=Belliella buryatensis TaxID=1500549 RepID=A0A239BG07_9BACT|nr:DUF3871 family protein [Belliella buryatensis]SNS06278.1 protein of unknown function [Belliella buryatensis]